MLAMSSIAAGIVIIIVCLILGYIILRGVSYINLDVLTNIATPAGVLGGGMRNEIIGTLILVGLGSIFAVPIGMISGIFLSEFAGYRMAAAVRFAADALSGIPSIITGIFVYAVLVKQMHSFSAFSAAVALATIMIPIVARTTEESMKLVPLSMREAALALGVTNWQAIVSVVIPGALTGIITGIMLGIARIAGETAPLIFTALGSSFGFNGLDKPIGALPLQIFRYATSPYSDWQQQAWAGAFILILLVLSINILVRWLARRRRI